MPFFIAGLDKRLQKVAGRIGHAVCILPDKHRDLFIDELLAAMTAAHEDPDTTSAERNELLQTRERLLSALADSPMKIRLKHDDELRAVAKKDGIMREKRQEKSLLKQHKEAYIADAMRNYRPPTKA